METDHYDNILAHESGTVLHAWHISFEGCLNGLERVYSIANDKPRYDLACFNCTDAAVSVGHACGAPVPAAGLPDFSIWETIRGFWGDQSDWMKTFDLSRADGSYSSPLGLLMNLFYINHLYGETE